MQPLRQPARARILDAAAHLMRTIGLARATTKEIAKAAGCSEAALYKYFPSKEDLFVHVLDERLPGLVPLLTEMIKDPGDRDLEENLTAIARSATLFYESSVPIGASLFAEPALLRRHREGLRKLGTGPYRPLEDLAAYLRAEQQTGRVRAEADPDAAAALLLGACSQRALISPFLTEEAVRPLDDLDEFAAAIARTVVRGIAADPA
ncbi:TetR/AcrR family transcriptional regulator [Streptomyces sp. NPDC006879]|uniref:TetR/AcrR family transcriptional regulator n=1 Tax=Streptomyces sp. NPDC006879 TaxID=3364767 RepID=UPI0036AC92F1